MSASAESNLKHQFISNGLLLCHQVFGDKKYRGLLGGVQKKLFDEIEGFKTSHPATEAKAIEKIKDLTPQEFQEKFYKGSRAVVLEQAAKSWPSCNKWDLDFFADNYGESEVLLVDVPGFTNQAGSKDFNVLTVKELIQDIKDKGSKYWRFSPILQNNPELLEDIDLDFLQKMRGPNTFANTYYLFMGGAGRKTYLHSDQPCNLYVQISGRKRWTIFYPKDSLFLYPTVTSTAVVTTPIDTTKPDLKKYPLFKYAQAYEVILNPGDILYMPPHVWHQVENLTDSISVAYRYSSIRATLKSSLTLSLNRMLSRNPPFWRTRKYGREDTNLIWAHANGDIKALKKERRTATT